MFECCGLLQVGWNTKLWAEEFALAFEHEDGRFPRAQHWSRHLQLFSRAAHQQAAILQAHCAFCHGYQRTTAWNSCEQQGEAAMSLLRLLLGQAPPVAPSSPHTVQLLMQRPQHHCGLDAVPEPQRPEYT